MPTGCKSEYLRESVNRISLSLRSPRRGGRRAAFVVDEPAGDLERRAENLRTHEFRHFVGLCRTGLNRRCSRVVLESKSDMYVAMLCSQ
jgi:hypothetical protein